MVYFGDPPRAGKWAFSDQPKWKERYHFCSYNGSNLDIMAKRRLASRAFGFKKEVPVYTTLSLTQPPKDCADYAPEDVRLNADIDSFVKDTNDKIKARKKEILDCQKADRAYRHYQLLNRREEAWDKVLEHEQFLREKPHAKVVSNTSGVPYDIITMQYGNSYAAKRMKHREDCARWRGSLRKIFLQARSSGSKNFNILTWKKVPPIIYPEMPAPLEAPAPGRILYPREKALERRVVPPPLPKVLRLPGEPVLGDGKTPELLDYGTTPEPVDAESSSPTPPPTKVRDVIVNVQHPWEAYYA